MEPPGKMPLNLNRMYSASQWRLIVMFRHSRKPLEGIQAISGWREGEIR
jgi:hypothetical protein